MSEPDPAAPRVPVRRLNEHDAGQLGAMLARAFAADPTSEWLFPRAASRTERLRRWYRLTASILLVTGEGWGTDDLSSAALWLEMGTGRGGAATGRVGQLLRWNLEAAALVGPRLLSAALTTARVHRLHPSGPGWYLAVLGTDPDRQGRGLASAALAPVLERCDRDGLQAYLDTATGADVHFYERRGFEVVGELSPARAPHFWVMRRPPASGR
jgi:ribosomal protein S18 acetylase RimI-like enzyme